MSIKDHHLYRSLRELIDREAAATGMTGPQVAQVLIAILAEVIEAAARGKLVVTRTF